MKQSSLSIWETLHANGRMPKDTWPPDDMIRQISRLGFSKHNRSSIKCLDIGCGSGPMTWYLAKSGYNVTAIDYSNSAVSHTSKRLHDENLSADINTADICNLQYQQNSFDFCVDIQSLMCLSFTNTKKAIKNIYNITKKDGFFLSRTATSSCWGVGIGTNIGLNEWKDATSGPFVGMGLVRFVPYNSISELYSPFKPIFIENTITTLDNMNKSLSMWIIVCKKL